jgi:hypothetical protein
MICTLSDLQFYIHSIFTISSFHPHFHEHPLFQPLPHTPPLYQPANSLTSLDLPSLAPPTYKPGKQPGKYISSGSFDASTLFATAQPIRNNRAKDLCRSPDAAIWGEPDYWDFCCEGFLGVGSCMDSLDLMECDGIGGDMRMGLGNGVELNCLLCRMDEVF